MSIKTKCMRFLEFVRIMGSLRILKDFRQDEVIYFNPAENGISDYRREKRGQKLFYHLVIEPGDS